LLAQHLSLLDIPPFYVVEPTLFIVQNVVVEVVVVFSRFRLSIFLVVQIVYFYDLKSIPIILCQITCLVLHLKRSIPPYRKFIIFRLRIRLLLCLFYSLFWHLTRQRIIRCWRNQICSRCTSPSGACNVPSTQPHIICGCQPEFG
jgi:hypothetical protein